MKLPTDAPRNQIPIIDPTTRAGASLVIELRPTGLRHNSAKRVNQVHGREPQRADEGAAGRGGLGRWNQDDESEPDADETDGELDRAGGLLRPHRHPQPREDRRQDDDEQRVQRLEPAARESEPEELVPGAAVGEQIQRGTGLLEDRPEHGGGQEEHENHPQPSALFPGPALVEKQHREKDDRDDQERIPGQVANGESAGSSIAPAAASTPTRTSTARAAPPQISACRLNFSASCGVVAPPGAIPADPSRWPVMMY